MENVKEIILGNQFIYKLRLQNKIDEASYLDLITSLEKLEIELEDSELIDKELASVLYGISSYVQNVFMRHKFGEDLEGVDEIDLSFTNSLESKYKKIDELIIKSLESLPCLNSDLRKQLKKNQFIANLSDNIDEEEFGKLILLLNSVKSRFADNEMIDKSLVLCLFDIIQNIQLTFVEKMSQKYKTENYAINKEIDRLEDILLEVDDLVSLCLW